MLVLISSSGLGNIEMTPLTSKFQIPRILDKKTTKSISLFVGPILYTYSRQYFGNIVCATVDMNHFQKGTKQI